ncbi:thiamine pyrophosphate protein central region [Pseudarthrobacter chlorophenolicus A6]|uniref:Thiamine pyrophosphate protein central region n=1 Tax=Pseudarthrobacter chlorophenolicus (strain ATCC 700700 / DSM 12829 / CIP 107037 / JCM 12360 / KCTC 9906 / NCIMB 13794 / A6) TaxID=452863 RepID=B8HDF8_PSECP|nr:thiamine pyrophosphate-binding protein [Pseudarthrobacter chlorophenolicus]ACL38963.1 thiamine pyrophosphate protein central region [Pseudarthrobacter chlorophenolicus A6]SDR06327.1 acetolactate synthase-1/2/3 large subunit [Pseudarthrobacter chlorophenolicus]
MIDFDPGTAAPTKGTGARNGGDLVVETLEALGAKTVFGIPGQHALGLFDAMGRGNLQFVSSRVENNSAFAADGYSRATGEVGVLFLSTGPGALTSLAGLQEAYATGVPMVVVASQIPLEGLGARRKGMLHQLDDQKASAANVTKSQRLIQHASGIPSAIQDAWTEAISSPQGPVWIEIPQNVLLDPIMVPPVEDALAEAADNPPRVELVREAVKWLQEARRPAIIAGGGTRRGEAEKSLLSIAEKLRAPVICTPGGNGAFPWNHELSLQSWIEDRYMTDVLEDADVLVVIGSSLGEVTSNYFTFEPRGRIIQIDAEPRVLESNRPGLGIRADAGQALAALDEALAPADVAADWHGSTPEELVKESLAKVRARLESQDLAKELAFMADIREAVPADMQTFWDMTIASYWGWSCWDSREGQFHSAQGAGGLGYGFPAAIGAAVGLETLGKPGRVLAVSGDGSSMYSISELATAKQHNVPVTWLIVDDGGYGILREYMVGAFGKATATELARPDFVKLAEAFGVPAVKVAPGDVGDALKAGFAADGPNVVVVETLLKMFGPTHLGD